MPESVPAFVLTLTAFTFLLRHSQHHAQPYVVNDAPLTDAIQFVEHLIFGNEGVFLDLRKKFLQTDVMLNC